MKRVTKETLRSPVHRSLWEKDERELYGTNPHDYYAIQYRQRIQKIVRTIVYKKSRRMLEIGSAQCNISLKSAERGCIVSAVDIVRDHLTYGKLKHDHGDISFIQANAEHLPFKQGSFDCVVLAELLEHCAYPESIFAAAKAVLCPQGILVITTPNGESKESRLKHFSEVKSDRRHIEQFQFGPDGDDHLFAFTAPELAGLLRDNGFTINKASFIGHHFLKWKQLFHLRHYFGFFWNVVLENIVPSVPGLNRRYTYSLFFVANKND